jgi:ribonuclease D
VIDPVVIRDVTAFWETLASGEHETVVHAGRNEIEFCLLSAGRQPRRLVDVQLAAGLVGAEYPAGLGTLVSKFLARTPPKHETRTDWQRRPLSKRQIEYALNDARYLPPLRDAIFESLDSLGRRGWLSEEMEAWQQAVDRSLAQERWRRVSGNSSLNNRELAIVRELFLWRDAEARHRDMPVRRILRDDLIVELARRASADPKRIQAVRGMERGDLRKRLPELAAAIGRGLDLPEAECPPRATREHVPELSVLGQFLFAALGSICRQAQLAPNLVAGPNDIRQWIAHRTGKGGCAAGTTGDNPAPAGAKSGTAAREPPQLARGWRADFVGRLFEDLLDARLSIRVGDPKSEHPLVFEPRPS